MKITEIEFNIIETYGGYFKGIAFRNEDASVSLDVFDVYKTTDTTFTVKENGEFRYLGDLISTILYCAKWL
ncbi:hypothetical protein P4571_08030 [Niallia alba]|uniref:hypothetical protein n=1 Tax=Niallia alba TaxID=2729105 RepID=UPI002E1B5F1A|nr:hypothetical protein [Niallia alba]